MEPQLDAVIRFRRREGHFQKLVYWYSEDGYCGEGKEVSL